MATPYDWTISSGTPSQESDSYQGEQCLGLIGATALASQHIALEKELAGQSLTFTGWVKGKIAAAPKLRLTVNGADYDSSTVTVDDTYQQLTVSASISDITRPIYAKLVNSSASYKAYFDSLWLRCPNVMFFLPLSEAFSSVERILIRSVGAGPGAAWDELPRPINVMLGYGRMDGSVSESQIIRLIGKGIWPSVNAYNDSVKLNSDQTTLVALRAGQILARMAIGAEHLSETDHWQAVLAGLIADEQAAVKRLVRPPTGQRTLLSTWR